MVDYWDPANANVIINRDKPQAQFNEGLMKGAYSYFEGSQQNYKKHLYQFVNAGYINLNYKPNETRYPYRWTCRK